MKTVVEKIFSVCETINSERNIQSVMDHLEGETWELRQEVLATYRKDIVTGDDGVVGEAVDVILCALDIIKQRHPEFQEKDLHAVVDRKLAKWQRLYGQGKTHEQILKEKMEEYGINVVRPGFVNPEATNEQVCAEINKSLDQIILGNFDKVE